MKLSRTTFGLVATIAGLAVTIASLAVFGWACIDRQGQVALLFDTSLGPILVGAFIAGVVTTLVGVVALIVLVSAPPGK